MAWYVFFSVVFRTVVGNVCVFADHFGRAYVEFWATAETEEPTENVQLNAWMAREYLTMHKLVDIRAKAIAPLFNMTWP